MNAARRGFTMVELVAAAALLAALTTVVLTSMAHGFAQRRLAERRAVALVEAANILERLQACPWNELTSERLAALELAPSAQQLLPGSKLAVQIEESPQPRAKRIKLALSLRAPSGWQVAPLKLTGWVYPRAEK